MKNYLEIEFEITILLQIIFLGGCGENQQLAQLQILYKARGRKIEELSNEIEVLKSDSGREMRILKHQLSVARGNNDLSFSALLNACILYLKIYITH